MIRAENVTFSYDDKPILKNLSISENEPVITGLWGRNGSGKTTFMKLLAGHLKPTKGTIKIMGLEPHNNIEASERICYMQEDHPFSSIWNIHDALRYASYFNKNWDWDIADQLAEEFNLPKKKKITKLSKGMKSALQIVIGLASFSDVTILDEPTNGLDAAMRKTFYKVLHENYEHNPRLILISTHHIEEIQPLCESLMVIHNQRVMLHESMDDVRMKGIWLAGDIEKVKDFIGNEKILEQKIAGTKIKVMVDLPYDQKIKKLAEEYSISLEKADLQDYLLNITEKEEVLS